MIDKNKTYKTRDGHEVRIYATDGYTNFPVHGALKNDEGWMALQWQKDGSWHPSDKGFYLVEVKPRIKREYWINIYDGEARRGHAYLTREQADLSCNFDRIACVKVEIDCEEGEGL
jgi:hypothetical protein